MIRLLVLVVFIAATVTSGCASAGPADGVPPVAEEVNDVKPVEKPGAADSDDEEFGAFEVPEDSESEEEDAKEDAEDGGEPAAKGDTKSSQNDDAEEADTDDADESAETEESAE